ncbi:methylated-DNA--[protein]-cysteine S-methyltransferase [Empedobacter brevis]
METIMHLNYKRIANAIEFIQENFQKQPQLHEIAAHVNMSPAHFQRMFTEWAGTSPKKFLQYISIEHAKEMLKNPENSIFETTYETGLSSTSRLHDLFITIEGMTPAEYKNGGADLKINYTYIESPFGMLLIASTEKGICHMAFEDNFDEGYLHLTKKFSNADFESRSDVIQTNALKIFDHNQTNLKHIKLHLKGTDFQLKVWESLLKIPNGNVSTYGKVAEQIGNSKASRAVGTAIGQNPIAYLIPCHRVIQSTGKIGNYMWGKTRKAMILGWEASHDEKLI